jgi:hypothetical protein
MVDSDFWTPPNLSAFNGGGGPGEWFSQCGTRTTCQLHILPDPPHSISLTTYPPSRGTYLTTHPIPPTSLCHRTPLPCHTSHSYLPIGQSMPSTSHSSTRWPINVIPRDRYSSSHHLCHNGHPFTPFNFVSSPLPYCSPIQT